MALQDPLNTNERDWSAPEHSEHKPQNCRGCRTILAPHADAIHYWNGWSWCAPCYKEITALAMDQLVDSREVEGQERAARQDIERDDTYVKARRI